MSKFIPSALTPDKPMAPKGPEGYKIYDTRQKAWFVGRVWYGTFLGWVDFWSHRAAEAQRFPGAKAARRMIDALSLPNLAVINRKGAIL